MFLGEIDANVCIAWKVKLGQALSAYLPLCAGVSLPLRNRLDSLQKEFNLYGDSASKSLEVSMMDGVNVNALQFEASVIDGPVVNSRAGLYVYVNAMVSDSHRRGVECSFKLTECSSWDVLLSMIAC